jgi:hypothetical protein
MPPPAATDFGQVHDHLTVTHGWTLGPPPAMSHADLATDVERAACMPCGFCGWAGGLAYAPFHREGEYLAIGVCPNCGDCTLL